MWVIFVLSVLMFQSAFSQEDLIVQTANGKVQGVPIETPSGKTFYAWRGIPYARPPVGILRFLPPRRSTAWDDVRDGSQDSPACVFFGSYAGDSVPANGNSEDCLYINVYSPVPFSSDTEIDPTRTVLFWIYGGGFKVGSGEFGFTDPTPFLEEGVVVVTFNYRLGAFGFLSTEDDIILGNAGLKDQQLAIIWVRENIAYFGGNPLDITLFGESAGGMSVGYHIVSPMTKNLYKAAILESGNALTNYLQSDAKDFAYSLASQVDSSITSTNSSAEVRDVLQEADGDQILSLTLASGHELKPVIEAESHFALMSTPLYDTIEAGDFAQVPIIIGHNSEETLTYITDIASATETARQYDTSPELLVPNMPLKIGVNIQDVGLEIKEQYVGADGSFGDNLAAFLEWWSDDQFVRSTYKQAILQSNYSPVYLYQFSYYGTRSKDHPVVPGAGQVGHADEVGYLFNISGLGIETDEDYLTRRRLVKLWTNFAKTLNPTPDDDSAELLQNVKWEPVTPDNVQFLDIGSNLEVKPSRKVAETAFWDYIWETYSYRPYNTL